MSRSPSFRSAARLRLLWVLLLLPAAIGLTRCREENALLLEVRAEALVETFDLKVKDLETGSLVLDRKGERVITAAQPNRDISKPGEELKLAIEFPGPGKYLVYILGRSGQGADRWLVAVRQFRVKGVREARVKLVRIKAETDQDGDLFPACSAFTNCDVFDDAFSCLYLDCDDTDAKINPFGVEICDNGKDDDCSARCDGSGDVGDDACEDKDGDGVPVPLDCDDNNPCVSPQIVEAKNLCDYPDGLPPLPQVCLDWLEAQGQQLVAPYCADDQDQDCNGRAVKCETDGDCDGFPAADDCDDTNAKVNKLAVEECDGIDNNCDKVIDEGCLPCDVDGDAHALQGYQDPTCDLPKDDHDDLDAGKFPGISDSEGGREGGHRIGALRGFCRSTPSKNGEPEREVDHDGDGLAAKDDGCAPAECDADGDGFAAADCTVAGWPPSAAEADCAPDDPTRFPGAPDKCDDIIPQNCIEDRRCTSDGDNDGYLAPDDCDDGDPDVHPWATEICDGEDNDCDGLVDEGNPNHLGELISTVGRNCNDSSVGQCFPDGEHTGQCACSRQIPTRAPGSLNPANRVACSGEDESAQASQRCFGAAQPEPERCDSLDWDCNGQPDDPTGANFADKGLACSTDTGQCAQGKVVGCDLSHTIAQAAQVKQVLSAQGLSFNEHWVCSAETVFPVGELCNGLDDDCDGVLPSDERDQDTDHYLGCSGCSGDLASAIEGCGDCQPDNVSVHPNARELCNGVDDDCRADNDGAGECGGSTPDCCSTSRTCHDLQSDFFNCRQCGRRCDDRTADRCVGGSCVCGSSGAPCGSGLNCVDGQCRCIENGRCGGCCAADGRTCVSSPTTSACGRNGKRCNDCDDGNPCTSDSCGSDGQCDNNRRSVHSSCPNGHCDRNGVCCDGCIDSSENCHPSGSVDISTCGKGGQSCKTCPAGQCKVPLCQGGVCGQGNAPDITTACSGGRCLGGNCCDGCISGGQCYRNDPGHCGEGGTTSCDVCASGGECQQRTCDGSCGLGDLQDGTDCSSGKCLDGSCCSGCIDGSQCRVDDPARCGPSCKTCPAPECKLATCNGVTCGTNDQPDGTSCQSGAGECAGGSCCTDCRQGSSCYAGDTTRCGPNCVDCESPPPAECKKATCSGGVCGTDDEDDGTDCQGTSGKCLDGACCTGCVYQGACYADNKHCGSGGGVCNDVCTGSQTCGADDTCE